MKSMEEVTAQVEAAREAARARGNVRDTPFAQLLAKYGFDYPSCYSGVGEGWFPILETAIAKLQLLGHVRISQIKEKFGRLTIYFDIDNEASDAERALIRAAVNDAVSASCVTCEFCGAPGEMRCAGWHKVRCDACQGKHLAPR